jgi:hypothetical protein
MVNPAHLMAKHAFVAICSHPQVDPSCIFEIAIDSGAFFRSRLDVCPELFVDFLIN